jgi:hypothetical protein
MIVTLTSGLEKMSASINALHTMFLDVECLKIFANPLYVKTKYVAFEG